MCNGFTKGAGAMFSRNLKHDHKDAPDNRLFNFEQWPSCRTVTRDCQMAGKKWRVFALSRNRPAGI